MELYSVINRFPVELRGAVSELVKFIREDIGSSREDFSELKEIVKDLAQAQKRTEGELEKLKVVVHELAQAQKRTEERVEELAQAQKKTEEEFKKFRKDFHIHITALGSRWGLKTEASFRNGMREILKEIGYKVERFEVKDEEGVVFGYPEQIELDVIIRNDKVILVEIKSAVGRSDVYLFLKKCNFYEKHTGKDVSKKIFITPAPDNQACKKAEEFGVTICSFVDDIEKNI